MSDFRYAAGRTAESVQFLTEEIREFDKDYSQKTWEDYQMDRNLQTLMDPTNVPRYRLPLYVKRRSSFGYAARIVSCLRESSFIR
jgi:hypothetical protein